MWHGSMILWFSIVTWLVSRVPGYQVNGDIFYRSSLFILAGAGAELLSSQPAVSQQEEKTENKSHLGKLRGGSFVKTK